MDRIRQDKERRDGAGAAVAAAGACQALVHIVIGVGAREGLGALDGSAASGEVAAGATTFIGIGTPAAW